MKFSILLLFFTCYFGFGQIINFKEVHPYYPVIISDIDGLKGGADFADIDNDGDLDLLISGQGNGITRMTKLYIFENNKYEEQLNDPFPDLNYSNVQFLDYNGDGNIDLFLSGYISQANFQSFIFINDGTGNFTELPSASFGSSAKKVFFEDLNNDGLNDFFIPSTKSIYFNDGFYNYPLSNQNLSDITLDGCELFDIDGDNDLDILSIGNTGVLTNTAVTLYINDGIGNFTTDIAFGISYSHQTTFKAFDFDQDNDLDIFLTGLEGTGVKVAKLFVNDGTGSFTTSPINFEGIVGGDIAFLDINNDSFLDVCYNGTGNNGVELKIYLNNQTNFVEYASTVEQVDGTLISQDFDNDGINDLFVSGTKTKLYKLLNDTLTEMTSSPFPNCSFTDLSYGDIDGDNDLDLMIISENPNIINNIFLNDGTGYFTDTINPFTSPVSGESELVDVDGDGDLDIFIFGSGSTLPKLYVNNGTGVFTEQILNIPSLNNGDYDLSDIDNDGDLDLIMSGELDYWTPYFTQIYLNNGGVFSPDLNNIVPLKYSNLSFGDIDNDNDNDLLIIGHDGSTYVIKKYLNDGSGIFVEQSTSINPLTSGDMEFADLDGDNDLDLLLASFAGTEIYINDGYGNFTLNSNNNLFALNHPDFDIGDIDKDGDLDFIIIGGNGASIDSKTILYLNDGQANFTECTSYNFISTRNGNVKMFDFDNDNDLDVITSGERYFMQELTKLYENTTCYPAISYDTVYACNSYLWIDGNTYNSSTDSAFYIIPNGATNGCDSIINLNLSIFTNINNIDTVVACDSYTWIDGVTYYNNNNTASFVLNGGCTISLDLTINNSSTVTDSHVACNSFTWIDGETYYHSNNSAQYILTNGLGCDSIINLNLSIESPIFFDTIVACDSFTWINGVTYYNSLDSVNFTLINQGQSGCDSISILNLTINIGNIDNIITQNNITLTSNESNGDTYNLIDCNTNNIWYNTTNSVAVPSPGTYAIEITKNGCVDTTNCITITNQDFYNLPNYVPLTAEVFAYPVSSLDTCDAIALAFANGGFPPYNFDWFTQIYNDYSDINDSLCQGFHTLKVYDMIGDSIFIDYYVTDSINWYNWYNNLTPYVDTIYMVDQNCSVDMNNPIDSAIISNFYYLYGSTNINEDYFYMEITYFQSGTQFTFGDTVLMNPNGEYLINFSIICPNKATSRIKTIVTSMNPEILNVNTLTLNEIVKIYPNPTTGDITLYLGKDNTGANISVFDLTGKIIYKKNNINDNSIIFSIHSIETGIYFVKIEMNNKQHVIKLIKE